MWFPSFFQTISLTQRGRVLFVLVIAIFVGVVIGVSQGPSPKASTFDVRPADAGMTIAAPARTSIVGEAIPLPTQPPADNTQVIAAAAMATQTDTILTTEAITRDIDGKVVVRADAFAPEDQPQPELRMASAFAGIPAFDSFAPAPEQWPGFSSLGGGGVRQSEARSHRFSSAIKKRRPRRRLTKRRWPPFSPRPKPSARMCLIRPYLLLHSQCRSPAASC
jgi:hypothetical protein